MDYGYTKSLNSSFEAALAKTKEELRREGFGVLAEIDVRKILKEKLDVDYEKYVILGVCNPSYAHRALKEEKMIGLLLPCNVVVREAGGSVEVSAVLPGVLMAASGNERLKEIAAQAEGKLKSAIDKI